MYTYTPDRAIKKYLNDIISRGALNKQDGEAEARKELEDDGCPPCYPADVEISPRDINSPPNGEFPGVYQKGLWDVSPPSPIVRYWSAKGNGSILENQLRHWKCFRAYQQKTREYFTRHPHKFNQLVENTRPFRETRQTYGYIPLLLLDVKQHSKLQNWVEYQTYTLAQFDALKRKRKDKWITGDARKPRRRHVLLQWIEAQRLLLVSGEQNDALNSPRHDPTPTGCKRKREDSAVPISDDQGSNPTRKKQKALPQSRLVVIAIANNGTKVEGPNEISQNPVI
ncbi:hypothetical protein FQN57_004327 [Myotisia sp. PD_48]|nr:hypothetical protein FQN57_004327 [Myotisia sp. PD_48]